MDAEKAKQELEMAEYRKGLWERHLNQANQDWVIAQRSKNDNDLYYRLRREHGDDYMKKFREAKEHALKKFRSACEKVEEIELKLRECGKTT